MVIVINVNKPRLPDKLNLLITILHGIDPVELSMLLLLAFGRSFLRAITLCVMSYVVEATPGFTHVEN
jgi:hypothetical protein